MVLPNVCTVCGGTATRSCMKCGKMACEAHFVPSVGVCTACMGVTARKEK